MQGQSSRGFLLLGLTVYLFLSTVSPNLLTREDPVGKCDIIVVLGGEQYDRSQRAFDLYSKGYANRILVSGRSEEQLIGKELLRLGVRKEDLVFESDSRSTYENALFSVKHLKKNNTESAIIVTSWYHSRRALKAFQSSTNDIRFISLPTEKSKFFYFNPREVLNTFKEHFKIIYYDFRYHSEIAFPLPKHR